MLSGKKEIYFGDSDLFDNFGRQLNDAGELGPMTDICLIAAERTFRARWG